MKKIFATVLVLVVCLSACAQLYTPSFDTAETPYMGEWRIYTQPVDRGESIGKLHIVQSGEETFAIEITDFTGGVDITQYQTAFKVTDGFAASRETVENHGEQLVMQLTFTIDANGEKTIVLDFANAAKSSQKLLESLYLYRE